MRRAFAGLCVAVCVAGLVSAQPKDKGKSDKGAKDTPLVKATIVKVEAAKKVLSVKMDGKTVELPVGKEVKFIGPKGGVAKQGIKDRRLKPGIVLGLMMDGKTLREVHIPVVPRVKDKGKDKGKEKTPPPVGDRDKGKDKDR